ncbi:MAG: hypothetical protein M1819_000582 [Sarea resinae]|nr:MAG: hypothetical protein M1819_000582 [Sarea resinae]
MDVIADQSRQEASGAIPEQTANFIPVSSPSSRKRRRIDASTSGSLSKESTQESRESGTAEQWFDNSNHHVGESLKSSFVNVTDDPPYYMTNARPSPTEMDVCAPAPDKFLRPQSSIPLSSKRSPLASSASISDDFRSVIDDLTVQNKKLKRRLRKYEDLHCAQLENEKLFEVRIHGLPPGKRRELEETLKRFAASLGNDTPRTSSTSKAGDTTLSAANNVAIRKASTSSTSDSRVVDSAYASMSTSGQTPAGLSSQISRDKPHSILRTAPREPTRQNSLYDIPRGLLPQHPTVMTEKARKKLVVRRLEELFTGKLAAKSGHKQPLQQQEISTAAAKADRNALEALGRRTSLEGIREARILTRSAEAAADQSSSRASESLSHVDSSYSDSSSHERSADATPSGGGSPQQRPTRPLDLDPYRAQVPAENIEYIRHLGFSSPPIHSALSSDAGGWVYLNVLTNMAQLHTINVTTDFVKRAVTEYSDQFELSPDAQKLRWKGGQQGTHFSSDSGSPADAESSSSSDERGISSAAAGKLLSRQETTGSNDTFETQADSALGPSLIPGNTSDLQKEKTTQGASAPGGANGSAKVFDYRPLLFRESSSSSLDDLLSGTDSMDSSAGQAWTDKGTRKSRDGAIIFYNQAKFCTDLSGDRDLAGPSHGQSIAYNLYTGRPLGQVSSRSKHGSRASSSSGQEISSSRSRQSPDAMDMDHVSQADDYFPFSPHACSTSSNPPEPSTPFKLEASGVGDIRPADNFTLDVHVRHDPSTVSPFSAPKSSRVRKFLHRIPRVSIDAFRNEEKETSTSFDAPVTSKVLSINRTDHHPASLPSPSYLCPSIFSDGDSTSSIDESDESLESSGGDEDRARPSISISNHNQHAYSSQQHHPLHPSQPCQILDASSSSAPILHSNTDHTHQSRVPARAPPASSPSPTMAMPDLDAPVRKGSSSAATIGDETSVIFRDLTLKSSQHLARSLDPAAAAAATAGVIEGGGGGEDGPAANVSRMGR